jgi:hypothetical protein
MYQALRSLVLFLALFLAAPTPVRAMAPSSEAAPVVAAAPAPPLLLGITTDRTGIIQICVVVAAVAILILIKKLH